MNHTREGEGQDPKGITRIESSYPLMRMEKSQSGFCTKAAKHLPSAGRNRGGRRKCLVFSENEE